MPKCTYCPEEGTVPICLACRTKYETLEAENVRLRRDVAYLRQLNAQHRAETRVTIHREMGRKKRKKK